MWGEQAPLGFLPKGPAGTTLAPAQGAGRRPWRSELGPWRGCRPRGSVGSGSGARLASVKELELGGGSWGH